MTGPGARVWVAVGAALTLLLAVAGSAPAAEPGQPLVFVRPQPSGPPGSGVAVVGLGFDEGKPIEVRWGSVDGQQLASAAGPDFAAEILIPDVSPGLYALLVASRRDDGALGSAAAASFLVTAPGSSPPADQLAPATTIPTPGSAEAATPTPPYLLAALAGSILILAYMAGRGRRQTPQVGSSPGDGRSLPSPGRSGLEDDPPS
ncbi:MAG: hypothetical protein ACT4OS_11660 [Acidimicrobiales bacterium]